MNLKELENNKYFKTQILEKWELLFDEWDADNNLYIILDWNLKIEKYISKEKKKIKVLANLKKLDIFWEGSLSSNKKKEVRISAEEKTELLKIDAKEFEEFIKDSPKLGIEILTSIIDLSNKRLLEANFLLTTSYNISTLIAEKKEFNNKNLFDIIDNILDILEIDYILILEKNPIVKNYFKIVYDTRTKWKMLDFILKIEDNLDLEEIKNNWVELNKNNFVQKLINKNENIWYLVFWQKNLKFDETQQKTINSISMMIAWFMKQKQYIEEEGNKI